MKKSITLLMALLLVMSMALVGCSSTPAAPDSQAPVADAPAAEPEGLVDESITIGYAVKTLSDTYMQFLVSGIKSQAATYPEVALEIADAQMDVNTQINQAEDFISKGVDVLLFCPQDADACAPVVEAANAAGIPVVEVCTETSGGGYQAYVGSNDVDAGEMLGNFVMDKLPDGGKVLILEGLMGQSSQIYRYEGLQNTILKESKYEVLECKTANWQRDQAMKQVEDWLIKYPQIDAIICENDDMAMGALEACEAAGRKQDIVILGVDGNEDNIRAVQEGRLEASILQNGPGQGTTAIDVCVKLAKGETVDERNMVPFELITSENAQKFLDEFYGG